MSIYVTLAIKIFGNFLSGVCHLLGYQLYVNPHVAIKARRCRFLQQSEVPPDATKTDPVASLSDPGGTQAPNKGRLPIKDVLRLSEPGQPAAGE